MGHYLDLRFQRESAKDLEIAGIFRDERPAFYDRLRKVARHWLYMFIAESYDDAITLLMDHSSQILYVCCSIHYRSCHDIYESCRKITLFLAFPLMDLKSGKGACSAFLYPDQKLDPLVLSREERECVVKLITRRIKDWKAHAKTTWICQRNGLNGHLGQLKRELPKVLLEIIRDYLEFTELHLWETFLQTFQRLELHISSHHSEASQGMTYHRCRVEFEMEERPKSPYPKTYFYQFPPLDFQRLRWRRKRISSPWQLEQALPFDDAGQALFTEETMEGYGVTIKNGRYAIRGTKDFKEEFSSEKVPDTMPMPKISELEKRIILLETVQKHEKTW